MAKKIVRIGDDGVIVFAGMLIHSESYIIRKKYYRINMVEMQDYVAYVRNIKRIR